MRYSRMKMQTAALVTATGTMDRWCCSRFDSLSVLASLLDLPQALTHRSPINEVGTWWHERG